MPLFGNAKIENPLVNQVMQLRGQGMSDNQIVQAMQNQGVKSHQIFDALSQADLVTGTPNMGGQIQDQQMQQPQQQFQQQAQPQFQQQSQNYPQDQQQDFQQINIQDDQQQGFSDVGKIEEVVEAVIDEKWAELMKEINKIIAWKEKIEANLDKMQQEVNDVKTQISEVRAGVMGKITDYDKNMTDVGSELKAMQKVFKDLLPELTENVGELSRIAGKMKKEK